MDERARRNLGAHYTSEKNILKLIHPLFLDELRAEFDKVKGNRKRLFEFYKKLRSLNFMDPACGCGNFLVVTYREARLLELDVMRAAITLTPSDRDLFRSQVDVDQFYGIEIEEFPAQIAQVALWLMDHQMNLKVSEEFGIYFARIPLKTSPNIIHGNALRLDWNDIVPRGQLSYIPRQSALRRCQIHGQYATRRLAVRHWRPAKRRAAGFRRRLVCEGSALLFRPSFRARAAGPRPGFHPQLRHGFPLSGE